MRPAFRLVALILLVCLIGSGRAEAGIWDWIEELNGPGPSTGSNLPFMISFLCKPYDKTRAASEGKGKELLRAAFEVPALPEPGAVNTCFYYDFHSFHVDEDVHFYDVNSRLWELGVSTKLHATVEIGGGVGRFSFNSRFPDSLGGTELSGGRLAVTFPRVVFKPLLAIPGLPKKPELGFVQFYFKNTILKGTLADENFASKEGTEFIRTNQRVESVGVTFDLTVVGNIIVKAVKKN